MLQKDTSNLEAERAEALSRLDACIQAQESQTGRHERIVASIEERLRRQTKEFHSKEDALRLELENSQAEILRLQNQREELAVKLAESQSHARSSAQQGMSSTSDDAINLRAQLEEKTAAYLTAREALEALSSTYAQYKAEAHSQLTEEKAYSTQLLTTQQELKAQVDSLTNKISTLQNETESRNLLFAQEKSSLEDEISRLQSLVSQVHHFVYQSLKF